jgi:hypothetical protein
MEHEWIAVELSRVAAELSRIAVELSRIAAELSRIAVVNGAGRSSLRDAVL